MEKPLESAGMGLQVGWGRVSENHQGRANGVSQVDGGRYGTCLNVHAGWEEGSSKEQWLLPAFLSK